MNKYLPNFYIYKRVTGSIQLLQRGSQSSMWKRFFIFILFHFLLFYGRVLKVFRGKGWLDSMTQDYGVLLGLGRFGTHTRNTFTRTYHIDYYMFQSAQRVKGRFRPRATIAYCDFYNNSRKCLKLLTDLNWYYFLNMVAIENN